MLILKDSVEKFADRWQGDGKYSILGKIKFE
jgi:hypothetical protein